MEAVGRRLVLDARRGDLISLVPLGGPVTGIHTQGLEYALRGETLRPGTTRGISNVVRRSDATVRARTGTLIAVRTRPARGRAEA